ncbi:MAG TPA: sulfatase, partial [Miltoncostaeaceae bacterium]|nr:sulfatase [Miltoncostaeaceae bacterium]
VVFRQAFCAASTCSASRACLLTGRYAHANGMLGLAHRGWSLDDYQQHIVHTLRDIGYHSTLVGEQHVSKEPGEIGYDEVVKITTTRATDVAPVTIDLLRRAHRRPFFLSVGFFETHREFFRPADGEERWAAVPAHLPDTPEIRRDMAAFNASARSLDAGIGAVLDELEALGLSDDTLVICTTDHGMPFPGAKATLTDRGIGVFLIMRGPGGFRGGRVVDALVSQVDIFPTVCDLAGIPPPHWLQGRSMLPLLRGAGEIRDELFAEGTYHAAYEPQRAIRTRRWKYIRRFDDRRTPVVVNTDDGPAKNAWLAAGWAERAVPPEELYDLVLDPAEGENLIDRDEHAAVARDLRVRLLRWMAETGDPLLDGPVDPPPGAEYNEQDQISPREPTRISPVIGRAAAWERGGA